MSADYSQIELRLMAHISEDANLMRAFTENMDVHRATAAEVFGVDPLQVMSEQRSEDHQLRPHLRHERIRPGVQPRHRAQRDHLVHRALLRALSGGQALHGPNQASAKAKGYVQTLLGRRVWLPEINSPNGPRKPAAERQAINAPMQGTAADIIKLAMLAVQKVIAAEGRAAKMVMQVHDELVFEVPQSEVAGCARRSRASWRRLSS